MLEALFSNNVVWTVDNDFGYEVVDLDAPENAALLEAVPAHILRPDVYYRETGRSDVYTTEVEQRRAERDEFLRSYNVDQTIIAAVCNYSN